MSSVVLGAGAACAASWLYNAGVALQALEARRVPGEHGLRASLIARLARRPGWLVGTALGLVGWPLQAAALLLAPLTVVQPGLAFGLIVLLVLGASRLGERVGARDVAAVIAIVVGVAGLASVAPDASADHAGGVTLAAALAVLGALALAPYALRRRAAGGIAAALSAGAAFAWSGLSTKLVADAVSADRWAVAVAWTMATGAASALALISEMTALQRRPATQVAPLVFVVQVAIPVLAAPLVTGESWAHAPLGPAGILAGLAVVLGGAVVLTTAPAVRSLVDEPSSVDSGTVRIAPVPSAATAATVSRGAPSAVTTTMSPLESRADVGCEAMTVSRPATGDASTVRPTRY
jgi:drug/metabolite transporter (DMT)-like permease